LELLLVVPKELASSCISVQNVLTYFNTNLIQFNIELAKDSQESSRTLCTQTNSSLEMTLSLQ
jgi:hypothetical protein